MRLRTEPYTEHLTNDSGVILHPTFLTAQMGTLMRSGSIYAEWRPTVILVLGLVSPFRDSSGTFTFMYVFGEFSHLVFSRCCLCAMYLRGERGTVSSSKEKAVTVAGISTSLLCRGFSRTSGCLYA